MCKKKYSENMQKLLREFSFRIDFYSMPAFKDEYVEMVRKYVGDVFFEERVLSEEERQIVDVDTISDNLKITIEDIISKRNYIFRGIDFSGVLGELYVSPYYILVRFLPQQGHAFDAHCLDCLPELFKEKFLKNKVNILNLYCITRHECNLFKKDIWQVLDVDAFPQIDLNTFSAGRYADSQQGKNCFVDVIRDLRSGVVEDETLRRFINVVIYTMAQPLSRENIYDTILTSDTMLQESLGEVAKCFKE